MSFFGVGQIMRNAFSTVAMKDVSSLRIAIPA